MRLLVAAWLVLLGGCASTGEEGDPRDPYEGFNRGVYRFNDEFDQWVATPVAKVYKRCCIRRSAAASATFSPTSRTCSSG